MSSKKIKKVKIKNDGVQYELDFNLPQASDIDLGLTRLSDEVESTSNVKDGVSATPFAVKTVNDKIELLKISLDEVAFVESVEEIPEDMETNKFYLETGESNDETLNFFVENASLTTRGITQLTNVVDYNQELAITPFGVKNALDAIKTNSLSYIIQPKITTPTNESTNQPAFPTITGSPYRSLLPEDLREKRIFQISELNTFETLAQEHEVQDDNFTVQTQLKGQTKYYFRIKDVSQSGQESVWSSTVSITTGDAIQVNVPVITLKGFNNSPTDILSGVVVECSEFGVEEGYSDTHLSTDWYITLSNGRSNVWQSLNDTVNKTSITIPEGTFEKSTRYRLFVVYRGLKYGDSAVAYIDFTTSDDFGTVAKPILEVEGAPSNVFETPLLSGGIFSNTRDPDVHIMSDWEIYPQDGGEFVFQSINDKINKGSITIPKGFLQVSTAYKARARYKGQKYGWSEWSEVVFNTVDAFASVATPTINCDQELMEVQLNANFTSSEFTMSLGEGTHEKTDWLLYKIDDQEDVIFQSLNNTRFLRECPDFSSKLEAQTNYILKVRYYDGKNEIWSDYGIIEFSTSNLLKGVATPIIRIEGTESNAVSFDSQFISSEIDCIGFDGTLYRIDWIVLKDGIEVWSKKNFNQPAYNIGSLPLPSLEPKTKYVIRCRHNSTPNGIWSKYGELEFTTASAESTTKPTIKFRMKTQIQLSTLCQWWDRNKFKVYKNGVYDETLTTGYSSVQTLSDDGDLIEIKNEVDDLYPYVKFYSHANYLMSVEAPLPTMRTSNSINANYLQTRFGGRANGDGIGYGMFSNCKLIETLPSELFKNNPQVTDFGGIGGDATFQPYGKKYSGGNGFGCFYGCTSLTTIPEDLFKYTSLVTSFCGQGGIGAIDSYVGGKGYGCFYGCTSLTSIPNNLFRYNTLVKIFGGVGGNGGRGYWGNGYGALGGDAYGCFANCTSLKEIPEDLFRYNINVTSFGGVGGNGGSEDLGYDGGRGGAGYSIFFGCSSLASIPENLFKYNIKVTDFGKKGLDSSGYGGSGYGTFYNCSELVVVTRIGSPNVTSADFFANGTKEIGTVYVPSGSTTSKTFKGQSSTVNTIEEN